MELLMAIFLLVGVSTVLSRVGKSYKKFIAEDPYLSEI